MQQDVLHYLPLPPTFFFFFFFKYYCSPVGLWTTCCHSASPGPAPPPSSFPHLVLWTELHIGITQGAMYCLIISASHPPWLQKLHIFALCVCSCVCVFVKGFHGYTVCCRILISRNLIVACNASRLHCSLAKILSIVFVH